MINHVLTREQGRITSDTDHDAVLVDGLVGHDRLSS